MKLKHKLFILNVFVCLILVPGTILHLLNAVVLFMHSLSGCEEIFALIAIPFIFFPFCAEILYAFYFGFSGISIGLCVANALIVLALILLFFVSRHILSQCPADFFFHRQAFPLECWMWLVSYAMKQAVILIAIIAIIALIGIFGIVSSTSL